MRNTCSLTWRNSFRCKLQIRKPFERLFSRGLTTELKTAVESRLWKFESPKMPTGVVLQSTLDSSFTLTTARKSRGSAKAIRLSFQQGQIKDAFVIFNSLHFAAAEVGNSAQPPKSPLLLLKLDGNVSSRLASHAFIHQLLRRKMTLEASEAASQMLERGFKVNSKTLEYINRSLLFQSSAGPQSLGHLLRHKIHTKDILDLHPAMLNDTPTQYALSLILSVRKHRMDYRSKALDQLLAVLLLQGEVFVAMLTVSFMLKAWFTQEHVAADSITTSVNSIPDGSNISKSPPKNTPVPSVQALLDIMKSIQIVMADGPDLVNQSDSEPRFQLALQALTIAASLLDQQRLPHGSIALVISTIANCPRVANKVWVYNDRTGEVYQVRAYDYFHDVLQRLLRSTASRSPAGRNPIDLDSYNALVAYALRHLQSPLIASSLLRCMTQERSTPPMRPDISTMNIILRSSSAMHRADISEEVLALLRRRQPQNESVITLRTPLYSKSRRTSLKWRKKSFEVSDQIPPSRIRNGLNAVFFDTEGVMRNLSVAQDSTVHFGTHGRVVHTNPDGQLVVSEHAAGKLIHSPCYDLPSWCKFEETQNKRSGVKFCAHLLTREQRHFIGDQHVDSITLSKLSRQVRQRKYASMIAGLRNWYNDSAIAGSSTNSANAGSRTLASPDLTMHMSQQLLRKSAASGVKSRHRKRQALRHSSRRTKITQTYLCRSRHSHHYQTLDHRKLRYRCSTKPRVYGLARVLAAATQNTAFYINTETITAFLQHLIYNGRSKTVAEVINTLLPGFLPHNIELVPNLKLQDRLEYNGMLAAYIPRAILMGPELLTMALKGFVQAGQHRSALRLWGLLYKAAITTFKQPHAHRTYQIPIEAFSIMMRCYNADAQRPSGSVSIITDANSWILKPKSLWNKRDRDYAGDHVRMLSRQLLVLLGPTKDRKWNKIWSSKVNVKICKSPPSPQNLRAHILFPKPDARFFNTVLSWMARSLNIFKPEKSNWDEQQWTTHLDALKDQFGRDGIPSRDWHPELHSLAVDMAKHGFEMPIAFRTSFIGHELPQVGSPKVELDRLPFCVERSKETFSPYWIARPKIAVDLEKVGEDKAANAAFYQHRYRRRLRKLKRRVRKR